MKRFGIVSYNIYCNFTNYGSALQSWALQQAIDRLGAESVLVDYCPDVLRDKNPLYPLANMWDTDAESRRLCELSMSAIRENACKFDEFYNKRFLKTQKKYTSENFADIMIDENLDGFICGSDTIFCIDEFAGFDDGYYANYSCMKNGYAVAYAASFGDAHFTPETYLTLNERLQNFKAIGLRESTMLSYVQKHTSVPSAKVLDPTLLLQPTDYDRLAAERQEKKPYLLLYARRYNPEMEVYAEKLAAENGWQIIEISLRADNVKRHRMFYEAGVEEFISLVKYAEFVVTNSYHGMIFSMQYQRQFKVFTREQCDTKIAELLNLLGLADMLAFGNNPLKLYKVDYKAVNSVLAQERQKSLKFLEMELKSNV